MEKKYLTLQEVAEYLGYSVNGIRNLIQQNRIPYENPTNGKLIFVREDIDSWVKGDKK
jgi:excisionase family DNA binding protein